MLYSSLDWDEEKRNKASVQEDVLFNLGAQKKLNGESVASFFRCGLH